MSVPHVGPLLATVDLDEARIPGLDQTDELDGLGNTSGSPSSGPVQSSRFTSVLGSFKSMLAEMIAMLVKSKIMKWLGGAVGGGGGLAAGAAAAATEGGGGILDGLGGLLGGGGGGGGLLGAFGGGGSILGMGGLAGGAGFLGGLGNALSGGLGGVFSIGANAAGAISCR